MKKEDLTSVQNACAGFFAAFFSSLTLCPTELIKCKLQAIREVQAEMILTETGTATVAAKNIINVRTTRKICNIYSENHGYFL